MVHVSDGTPSRSFCRICNNGCAILVHVSGGGIEKVTGDPSDPLYRGYTCVKGRNQGKLLRDPKRLLTPMKRGADGEFFPISAEQALDEIAAELVRIRDEHGGKAIAGYAGTMAVQNVPTAGPLYGALLKHLGSPFSFDPNTLDKGGKQVAESLLGKWNAPAQGFADPDVILLLGTNPLLTYTGFPAGSPSAWLRTAQRDGCKVIVADPRAPETAKRADVHLRIRPGSDVLLILALIKTVIEEDLVDRVFVRPNVDNYPDLENFVRGLSLSELIGPTGLDEQLVVEVARIYARAQRGYAMAGTGPHMSTSGTMVEYLLLVLDTLCGRWLREGDRIANPETLLPELSYTADATSPEPDWGREEPIGPRGLRRTAAGLPTSALPELMLADPGVKALISWGGNPAVAFPDQSRTRKALSSLELLVQIDPWLSDTARLATYILPPKMPLETAASTVTLDWLSRRGVGYGAAQPYARYTAAVVDPPPGSDLLDDWEFFYGILERLGVRPQVRPVGWPRSMGTLTFERKPSTEELVARVSDGGRIRIEEVKSSDRRLYAPERHVVVVAPRASHADHRLDVFNSAMLALVKDEIDRVATSAPGSDSFEGFSHRLLCRRHGHEYNTSLSPVSAAVPHGPSPAYLNPADLEEQGLANGTLAKISSRGGAIIARLESDCDVPRGCVSMAFGRAGHAADEEVAGFAATTNALTDVEEEYDPYTGQPRMSDVPVNIEILTAAQVETCRMQV